VARANLLAFEKDYVGAVNIGTGIETDINRLFAGLAEAAGSTQPVTHAPGKPGEQRRSCIDPSLAKKVLGWEPTVGLTEGLRKTVEFFRAKAREPARASG
jgi:UDP-glucose 4-epimerase